MMCYTRAFPPKVKFNKINTKLGLSLRYADGQLLQIVAVVERVEKV